MAQKYQDDELESKTIENFVGGYNSYSSGKSTVKDNEIPYGQNVILDDNGSATKVAGSALYSPEVVAGKSIKGIGWLKNTTYNRIIVACSTAWHYITTSASTPLTGKAFTEATTDFTQALDKLYGANGTDNLCYTANGSTVVDISANGNIGRWPVFFNQRIYMTNTTYPDRIYYSNPYRVDLTSSPPILTGFDDAHMFDTDLDPAVAEPYDQPANKNAGYIVLLPGAGVEITRLYSDNSGGTDLLYAYTKHHGIWKIVYAAVNADGSIAHSIQQIITSSGTPAGGSVKKFMNDTWFFSGDNINTYGEVAQFQSTRLSNKSGRVRTEIKSINATYRSGIVSGVYKDKYYFAYPVGTYNDKLLIYDSKFNAWSTPISGKNVSCFMEYEDDNGITYFLAGSSSEGYVYQLETTADDNGVAINGYFETKSTDCDKPIMKYFGFIDVFYTTLSGVLTYEVFIDEQSSITGAVQIGNSQDKPAGFGSLPFGSFLFGAEYDTNTTYASLAQNDSFRIDCNFTAGKKISVRFTNNVTGEQFKINGMTVYYLLGSVYE